MEMVSFIDEPQPSLFTYNSHDKLAANPFQCRLLTLLPFQGTTFYLEVNHEVPFTESNALMNMYMYVHVLYKTIQCKR